MTNLLLLVFFVSPLLALSSCPFGGDDHHHDHHHHEHQHQHHQHDGEIGLHSCNGEHGDAHPHRHGHSQFDAQDHRHPHPHESDCLRGHCDPTHSTKRPQSFKLPEEVAEEEDLRMYGFTPVDLLHDEHAHHDDPSFGLWVRALGCSLLVSMASLICLILLPLIISQGKPSQVVVDALAAFGAGAMLGDAFLHQLPHALGNSSGHSHSHGTKHAHAQGPSDSYHHSHSHFQSESQILLGDQGHTHSIQDLSVGLAVLAGILLFFIVEKIVRHVEELSSKGMLPLGHSHHHHLRHHKSHQSDTGSEHQDLLDKDSLEMDNVKEHVKDSLLIDGHTNGVVEEENSKMQEAVLRKRVKKTDGEEDEDEGTNTSIQDKNPLEQKHAVISDSEATASNLVLGYLNLFSDGVHNFTDGMALGSAFLLHGTVGGWSRTLFLLAHEIPQEVGDFGILLRSGFGVFKALTFNFLSALVALAGTSLAILVGGSPGHSSWIEGFTAGGFIYIAMTGVLPEMHKQEATAKIILSQLVSLCLGMAVALIISVVE